MNTQSLKRSKDRKVTNMVTPNGKTPKIANTFGLPAGREFACPNATSVCEKVCYAGKLERVYKGVREVLLHNWNLLKDASRQEMVDLLSEMVADFVADCDKHHAERLFRIHWDGDFFSSDYAMAWRKVIRQNPTVRFWVYTRVPSAAAILSGIENLSLYFSTDSENQGQAVELREAFPTLRLAYLSDTFADGEGFVREVTGRVGARCPENGGQIPLISAQGSACVSCGICPKGKADVRFSVKGR